MCDCYAVRINTFSWLLFATCGKPTNVLLHYLYCVTNQQIHTNKYILLYISIIHPRVLEYKTKG